MVAKVKSASAARLELDSEFIICARSDARSVVGLDMTISRCQYYIDAGASMVFPEGLKTLQEFEKVAAKLRNHQPQILLLANMTEFGVSELVNFKDLKGIGYNCVIYPVSTLRIALKAVDLFLADLSRSGIQQTDRMLTRSELYAQILNYNPDDEWKYKK